jgi:hypothetical protein
MYVKLLQQNKKLIFVLLLTQLLRFMTFAFADANTPLECDPYRNASVELTREYSDKVVNLEAGLPIDGLIVFVEFEDRRAVETDRRKLQKVSKRVSDFYAQMSEGGIEFEWLTHETAIRVDKSVATYSAGTRGNIGAAQIIVDVQSSLRREIEIDKLDFVLVVTPSTTLKSEISNSVTYLNRGKGIVNSVILASDFWITQGNWQIVAHEVGHAFGLLDLYSLEAARLISEGRASYLDQFKFMKSYDLMNWPNSSSPSFVMWNRFQIEPALSSRIICFKEQLKNYNLISINSSMAGYKAILVPLMSSRVLMIEARDALGVDANIGISDLGVITYVVNPMTESGKGPIRIDCSRALNSKYSNCGLKTGHSRTIEGIRVTLEKSSKAELVLSVSREP